jgi:flagellar biosynthesis anti-sigma factor FlgM
MKIDGAIPISENIQTQNIARRGGTTPQSTPAPNVDGQDQAQLSAQAGNVAQLKGALSQVPDIRQERVQALRQAVSGSYRISNQQLADAVGKFPLSNGAEE